MVDLWNDTDLPVLRAAVDVCNEGRGSASTSVIVKRTGFDESTVMASLRRLDGEQPPFFERMEKRFNGGVSHVFAPTGHAQRMTSQWPKAEDKLDELIKVLGALAEKEPDKERAKRFTAVRDHLSTGGRDFAVGVITNLITGG